MIFGSFLHFRVHFNEEEEEPESIGTNDSRNKFINRQTDLVVVTMSSEEDKPPAPPVRLTSNRGGSDRGDSTPPVDMRPLPKGKQESQCLFELAFSTCVCVLYFRTGGLGPEEEDTEKQDQGLEAVTQ